MKLYAHRKTVRYLDYGEPLDTVRGLTWSTTGKAQDTHGFELGDFDALLEEKRAECAESRFTIEIGEPVERRCDLNPHGLV